MVCSNLNPHPITYRINGSSLQFKYTYLLILQIPTYQTYRVT